jgi:outer membrane receptor protein involved in Fe transport
MVAGFYHLNWHFSDAARLVHSLRVERLEYDYDNKALTGNTRDDGTTCGFGGCLYNRPASRSDTFTNVAGRLGVDAEFGGVTGHVVFGTGFRPPQATELYRLQRGQDVADLQSERLGSLEVGIQGQWWEVTAFSERTRHFIFRDAAGFNVSDGRTRSHGVEFSVSRERGRHVFEFGGTYAEHRYDFDRAASAGELIEDGNLMDTAPRWLAGGRWQFSPNGDVVSELEMNYQGKHYIDAANAASYDGHLVVNWRGSYRLNADIMMFARLINVLDEKYADRADFTIFDPLNYRYFPAMPRQLYVGIEFTL